MRRRWRRGRRRRLRNEEISRLFVSLVLDMSIPPISLHCDQLTLEVTDFCAYGISTCWSYTVR
jgi:hypothetical protein